MRIRWRIGILLWTPGISALTQITAAQEIPADYQQVLKIVGKSGDYKSNVLKVNISRNDLHMKVAGVAVPTPFGFGGWFAMTKGDGGHDVLMGDLVLTQEEVNPVMSALLDHGLEVTALHNHFFWDEPRVFYMHVHGHGQAVELANEIKPALDLIGHGTPTPAASVGGAAPKSTIDSAKIAKIVGHEGEQTGAVYKITIGRDDLSVKEMGATINARMGLNTWAAILPDHPMTNVSPYSKPSLLIVNADSIQLRKCVRKNPPPMASDSSPVPFLQAWEVNHDQSARLRWFVPRKP